MSVFEKIVEGGPEVLAEVLTWLMCQAISKIYINLDIDAEVTEDMRKEIYEDYYKCVTAEYKG